MQKSFAKVTAAVEEHRIKLAAITKLIDEEWDDRIAKDEDRRYEK
jgi:adenosyl cobinamide kinase/adenosyl cobinamide phosphate guanylyltransferase